MEILLSYENLLDGAIAPLLKGLNVPPQHDGGGVAQKYIGVSTLETWYGKGWWTPHMSALVFVRSLSTSQVLRSDGQQPHPKFAAQPVHMREDRQQDPALRSVQNLAKSYRRVWMDGSILM